MKNLKRAAMVLAILGAGLLATVDPMLMVAGFAAWILSDAVWIVWAAESHEYEMGFQYLVFFGLATWGLLNAVMAVVRV